MPRHTTDSLDMGLPALFTERLRAIVPAPAVDAVLASFAAQKQFCVRANTLRADPGDVAAALAAMAEVEPLPGLPDAWLLPRAAREAVTASDLFTAGQVYVQNPASLVPPLVLAPAPDEEVLDLAAAPGGKSIHLAQLMQDRGRLACVEAVRGRFFRLRANLERCGVTIGATYLKDGRKVGRQVPGRFDRVLLDAPCSSEARFRADAPETWAHWGPRKWKECARKQRGLLLSALAAVKPGGRVLYCTCSFAPEENEEVVAWVLAQDGVDARVLPVDLPDGVPAMPGLTSWQGRELPEECAGLRRILPDGAFDGMVLGLLERV